MDVSDTDEGKRIAALDIVRGIAVMGILIANIAAFGQPLEAGFTPGFFLTDPGPGSDFMWAIQFVLVDNKMRGLFALMFGASMALFVDRAATHGRGLQVQFRRLLVLGIVGMAHGLLIWGGDILWDYAVIGLVMLPFLHLPREKLLTLGLVTAIAGAGFYALATLPVAAVADQRAAGTEIAAKDAAALDAEYAYVQEDTLLETALIRSGDWPGMVRHNRQDHADAPFLDAAFAGWELFPLMLIGAALFRFGLFDGALSSPPYRRMAWTLWLTGAGLSALIARGALARDLDYWATSAAFVGWSPLPALAMTVGLAILLANWAGAARGRAARLLAGAGRTAFTNYLGTSLVLMPVFHGWGLGLFGELDRAELYAIVPLVWAVMLAWPVWWLARFRFGPMEWLWRCATYFRIMPLRGPAD